MPRRSVLSAADRAALVAPPDDDGDRIRVYAFSETDVALVRQRRRDANRLGFAVQLCLLRYPGVALPADGHVDETLSAGSRRPCGSMPRRGQDTPRGTRPDASTASS